MTYGEYRVGVPKAGTYKLLINSEATKYGGEDTSRKTSYKTEEQECDGREFSIGYSLAPYGVAIFKY